MYLLDFSLSLCFPAQTTSYKYLSFVKVDVIDYNQQKATPAQAFQMNWQQKYVSSSQGQKKTSSTDQPIFWETAQE